MPGIVCVNPPTRLGGFLEIEAETQGNTVTDVRTKGFISGSFETALEGRHPSDSIRFARRVCGSCSFAYAAAASCALEDAAGAVVSEQEKYLRDFTLGCEFLQNHISRFMLSVLPDYIRLPDSYPLFRSSAHNNRLPTNKNERMVNDYFASMEINRSAHRMLSVLNGDQGRLTADMIVRLKALLRPVTDFVGDRMMPDIYEIADFYPEYYEIGRGYGNFLSYGCFCGYREQGSLYLPPLVTVGSGVKPLDPSLIAVKTAQYPTGAPRYDNLPYEVGTLARQWLSGNYRRGISTMDRLIAGVLESRKIASVLAALLDAMIPGDISASFRLPGSASGTGLIDTAEGALGHRIIIDDGRISSWRIISPSAWNFSPQPGMKGTVERAIMGTSVRDPDTAAEIVRTAHSFDPRVSCAAHIYKDGVFCRTLQIV